jgi:hypothetical protein
MISKAADGWLPVQLRILEVPRSNLSPTTGSPDWGISWRSSVRPSKFRENNLKLGYDHFLKHHFQLILYTPSY